MIVREASLFDLLYIAQNMRARDVQELSATRAVDPDSVAADAFSSPWRRVVDDRDGRPCLCVGARPLHSGVISMWGFGTNSYRDAARLMTNHIRGTMIPELLAVGVHRAQCIVHPENRASQRWLESLGFFQEAILSRFGAGNQDMFLFAWLSDEPTRKI